ncbi:hypothetical protein DFJ74DRAFT_747149 [Hyaloraphidium curvatum]|nr:hypothetical protein DFJ74DRAFT_747149 [Hyaloraphidium curvatum]
MHALHLLAQVALSPETSQAFAVVNPLHAHQRPLATPKSHKPGAAGSTRKPKPALSAAAAANKKDSDAALMRLKTDTWCTMRKVFTEHEMASKMAYEKHPYCYCYAVLLCLMNEEDLAPVTNGSGPIASPTREKTVAVNGALMMLCSASTKWDFPADKLPGSWDEHWFTIIRNQVIVPLGIAVSRKKRLAHGELKKLLEKVRSRAKIFDRNAAALGEWLGVAQHQRAKLLMALAAELFRSGRGARLEGLLDPVLQPFFGRIRESHEHWYQTWVSYVMRG